MVDKKKWSFIDKWSKKIRGINLLGGKCMKCGNDDIFTLSFHHRGDKEFEIGDINRRRWSTIKSEILKCDLLCENCHQEHHYLESENDDYSLRCSKSIYLEYKGYVCKECGYDECDASLTFHHIDDKEKKFCIGSLTDRIYKLSQIRPLVIDELNKCDLLCFNCHRKKHIRIDLFNKYKKEIYYKVDNFKEKQKKLDRELIFKLHFEGVSNKKITEILNCSKSTISEIINGKLKGDMELRNKYINKNQ